MTKLQFTTKAEILANLADKLRNAKVLPSYFFTVHAWQTNPNEITKHPDFLRLIKNPVIVRSSAIGEDGQNSSLAGKFGSVLNVQGGLAAVKAAINQVIATYGADCDLNNQLLIQPMLLEVFCSGVAFSCDPSNSAPYYLVNYDDHSGLTNTVTAGTTNNLTTLYHARYYKTKQLLPWQQKLIKLCQELELIFVTDKLDIEFAVTPQQELILLQVRPLIISACAISEQHHAQALGWVSEKFKALAVSHPYLYGNKAIYGLMPDWNPAEIIGVRPKPLALSLYKELITDNIWAYQRDNYGYRNLRSFPLLINFAGIPFIDVRVSFNSFVPADIEGKLADKLVNYYLTALEKNPAYHDKVEFEIIHSCYTLDLPQQLAKLTEHGFTKTEITMLCASLKQLTNNIIRPDGLWQQDIDKIQQLRTRQDVILNSELGITAKIYWLIEDAKRYGTLPFAGLARAGFVAIQLLKSLVTVNIFKPQDYHAFLGSLQTVSKTFATDFNQLESSAFLIKYGHLRPGTYDILSARYDETPDLYFNWELKNGAPLTAAFDVNNNTSNNYYTTNANNTINNSANFSITLQQLNTLSALLAEHGLEHDVVSFFNFIKLAIEGREYAKFVFTKSLSAAMKLIEKLGSQYVFSKADMAFANIFAIKNLYAASTDPQQEISAAITNGKKNYQLTQAITLPSLITKLDEIYSFTLGKEEPNFITTRYVMSDIIISDSAKHADLPGKIMLIQSADPGYDWIFAHGIKGFITKYGGANSHMAIRAAELDLPAVIGVGHTTFNKLTKVKKVAIDAANKKLEIIQ